MADLIDRAALLEIVNKINVADDTFGKAFGAGAQVGVEIAANKIKKAPAVDAVEVDVLKAWLYEMAMNNTSNYLGDACEVIISRLDGLKVFAREREET